MNTYTIRRRAGMLAATLTFTLLTFGVTTSWADAAAPARTRPVKLDDLDLSTEKDQQIAHERIHKLARRLCAEMADREDRSIHENYMLCLNTAMARADAALTVRVQERSARSRLAQSLP